MRTLLIADSGGTKTDWCAINQLGERHFFTTESYHPNFWNDEFVSRIQTFWNDHEHFKSFDLYFYCAGCLHPSKSAELTSIFQRIGFNKVQVQSDLHAAAISLYGMQSGFCAILGTGSVFYEWNDGEVKNIKGGKGYEIGDEGSGFYFGKLIFEAYLNNKLTQQQTELVEKFTSVQRIKKATVSIDLKKQLSDFPHLLSQFKDVFRDYHIENIRLFLEDVWPNHPSINLRIVGSYFANHAALFTPYLNQNGVHIQKFTARPIDSLVDYFVVLSE